MRAPIRPRCLVVVPIWVCMSRLLSRGSDMQVLRGERRRGVALVLVLFAVAVAVTLAYSFLAGQSTTIGISRNIENHAKARYVAESGLKLAIAHVRANEDWRTDQSHGTWVTDEPFGEGTYTIVGEDGRDTDGDGTVDGDGDLSDDSDDLLTLTVTGKVNGTAHVVRAILTPVLGTCLIGHWKLDEGSGQIAADATGNGQDGTLGNAGGSDSSDPTWMTDAERLVVLDFDGSNDYVSGIGDCPAGSFSIAGWGKHTGGQQDEWHVLYSADTEIWFGADSRDDQRFYLYIGGDSDYVETPDDSWTFDAWHHFAGTWDGTTAHIYIDGIDMTLTAYGSPNDPTAETAVMGAWSQDPTDQTWFGLIDDVRLYDCALSATEVEELATANPPVRAGIETILANSQDHVRRLQIATPVTVAEDMTATAITAYVGGKMGKEIRYAIYTDTAGEPDTLVAETAVAGQLTDAMAWFTIPLPSTSITAGTYWLALSFKDDAQQYQYTTGAGKVRYKDHEAAKEGNHYLATWGVSDSAYVRQISIYVSADPGGGASGGGAGYTYTVQWEESP